MLEVVLRNAVYVLVCGALFGGANILALIITAILERKKRRD